jgi:hypothetical protein
MCRRAEGLLKRADVTPPLTFPYWAAARATAGEHELGHIVDDRFDRRELLLHLGEVLEAMRHVASATRPYSLVAHLASREATLPALPFLQQVSPRISATDFLARAASAYAGWPRALLETDLDRIELAMTVRRELFGDDPQGWESYAAYVRQKVSWFGLDLDKSATPTSDPDDEKGGESDTSATKTGWPWKTIG